jgi:hypothetical protein
MLDGMLMKRTRGLPPQREARDKRARAADVYPAA